MNLALLALVYSTTFAEYPSTCVAKQKSKKTLQDDGKRNGGTAFFVPHVMKGRKNWIVKEPGPIGNPSRRISVLAFPKSLWSKKSFSEDTFVVELDRWQCIVWRHVWWWLWCQNWCLPGRKCGSSVIPADMWAAGVARAPLEWTVCWSSAAKYDRQRLVAAEEERPLHTWHLH